MLLELYQHSSLIIALEFTTKHLVDLPLRSIVVARQSQVAIEHPLTAAGCLRKNLRFVLLVKVVIWALNVVQVIIKLAKAFMIIIWVLVPIL